MGQATDQSQTLKGHGLKGSRNPDGPRDGRDIQKVDSSEQ